MGWAALRHYANLREPLFNLRFKLYCRSASTHSPPPLQLVSSAGEYSDPGVAARSSYQLDPLLALVRGGGRKVDSRWSQVYDDVSV